MTPTVVPARPEHVARVATLMREEDQLELHAISGLTPEQALAESCRAADTLWAAVHGGRAIAIFGETPVDAATAMPWMIGTDDLMEHRVWLARESVAWFDRMAQRWPRLTNWTDLRNQNHVRWLEWLGCDYVETAPRGPYELPFGRWEYLR